MVDINKYIAEAMKSRETERLGTLKLIKTELVKAEKSGVALDDTKELKILLKMIEQRKDAIEQYTKGGRQDLAEIEKKEIDVISEFIPEQPTEEEIEKYADEVITKIITQNDADWSLSMKDMGVVMGVVREKYPSANGKIVSKVLKERINNG